jgi:hypothetical protein
MTPKEISQLLAMIAMGDMRKVDKAVVRYWEAILPGWLTFELARDALIEHRRSSTDYLQPAHLVAIGERMRAELAGQARRIEDDERLALTGSAPVVPLAQVELPAEHREFLARLWAKDRARRGGKPTRVGKS